MYVYPKIETVFNRDMSGSKKLIEGDFRSKTIKMLSGSYIWNAYEKLDGSNHQISWDGHRLSFGGRTEKSCITVPVQDIFNNCFNNNETEEIFEQLFGDKPMVLYFEAVGPKIQSYGRFYADVPTLILLDVYNVNNNSWWDFEGICAVAKALGVEHKQIMATGSLREFIDFVKTKPTSIQAAYPLPIEGVVAIPSMELKDANGERIIVKIKCCDHCEDWSSYIKQFIK